MKTLICIRDLPHAETTVHFGGLLAGIQRVPVTLITVMVAGETREQAEIRLREAQALLGQPLVPAVIREGEPAAEILDEAEAKGYNLIVVGARTGVNLLNTLFMRPVARKVAKEARVCVLVVNEDRLQIRRILVCTAGDVDWGVLEVGASVAEAAEASMTLLHVANPVPSMYTGLGAMEETLEELLQTETPVAEHLRQSALYLSERGVAAELQLRHGVAQDEILREAKLGEYDLVVIGSGPLKGSLRNLVMDNVTAQVVDHAPCPVLVVRGGCAVTEQPPAGESPDPDDDDPSA